MRPPDVIDIDDDGVVWLIDLCPRRARAAAAAEWCQAQSATGAWRFAYLALDRRAIEASGAIAFDLPRW